MKINIVSVGKIKEKYLVDAIAEYEKRLSRFVSINNIEVKDEAIKDNMSEESIKKTEGARIIEALPQGYNIILDLKGKQIDSLELAHKIDEIFSYNNSTINFIIGGSLGLANEVLELADFRLCFSKMTFPHQLVKVIILEQIYRSFKILNNETYHK